MQRSLAGETRIKNSKGWKTHQVPTFGAETMSTPAEGFPVDLQVWSQWVGLGGGRWLMGEGKEGKGHDVD